MKKNKIQEFFFFQRQVECWKKGRKNQSKEVKLYFVNYGTLFFEWFHGFLIKKKKELPETFGT